MSPSRPIATQVFHDEARLEIEAAELRIIAGPDRGLVLPLPAQSLRIGTASSCGLVLHDSGVSALHAEIAPSGSGYLVRDLGSKNGLFLDTWRIDRAPLVDRMRLRLGRTTILVRALGQRQSVSLSRSSSFGLLQAHSVAMRAAIAQLEPLARVDLTVLLEGETGTGKEIAAQALHAASPRAAGPFVVFDCGAIPPELATSELFGYERGAFTGADSTQAGLFEAAEGGTLFLDEIGEMPLALQPILLGAIERRVSRRVGGQREVVHDVRLIAATNRNLAEEVRLKRFREDLYFRLAAARVRLPPLRERAEDIAPLAQGFAAEAGATLSPEMLAVLTAYDWPGNVRELKNALARLAAQPGVVPIARPPRTEVTDGPLLWSEARRLAEETFERVQVEKLLKITGGHIPRAAELAGVTRQFMHKLAVKHGLRSNDR